MSDRGVNSEKWLEYISSLIERDQSDQRRSGATMWVMLAAGFLLMKSILEDFEFWWNDDRMTYALAFVTANSLILMYGLFCFATSLKIQPGIFSNRRLSTSDDVKLEKLLTGVVFVLLILTVVLLIYPITSNYYSIDGIEGTYILISLLILFVLAGPLKMWVTWKTQHTHLQAWGSAPTRTPPEKTRKVSRAIILALGLILIALAVQSLRINLTGISYEQEEKVLVNSFYLVSLLVVLIWTFKLIARSMLRTTLIDLEYRVLTGQVETHEIQFEIEKHVRGIPTTVALKQLIQEAEKTQLLATESIGLELGRATAIKHSLGDNLTLEETEAVASKLSELKGSFRQKVVPCLNDMERYLLLLEGFKGVAFVNEEEYSEYRLAINKVRQINTELKLSTAQFEDVVASISRKGMSAR